MGVKSIEDTVANMRSALEMHFEGMAEDGDPIPASRGVAAYRDVINDAEYTDYVLAHVPIDVSRFAAAVN